MQKLREYINQVPMRRNDPKKNIKHQMNQNWNLNVGKESDEREIRDKELYIEYS